jgi:hypothetical protein
MFSDSKKKGGLPIFYHQIKGIDRGKLAPARFAIFDAITGETLQKQLQELSANVDANGINNLLSSTEILDFFSRIVILGLQTGFVHNDCHLSNIFFDFNPLSSGYKLIDLGRSFFNYELLTSDENVIDDISLVEYLKLNPSLYTGHNIPDIKLHAGNLNLRDYIRIIINKFKDHPGILSVDPYILSRFHVKNANIANINVVKTPKDSLNCSEQMSTNSGNGQKVIGSITSLPATNTLKYFKKYMFLFDIMCITLNMCTFLYPAQISSSTNSDFFANIGLSILNGIIKIASPRVIHEITMGNIDQLVNGHVNPSFANYNTMILGAFMLSIFFHQYLLPYRDSLYVYNSNVILASVICNSVSKPNNNIVQIDFNKFIIDTGIFHKCFQMKHIPNVPLLDSVLQTYQETIDTMIDALFSHVSDQFADKLSTEQSGGFCIPSASFKMPEPTMQNSSTQKTVSPLAVQIPQEPITEKMDIQSIFVLVSKSFEDFKFNVEGKDEFQQHITNLYSRYSDRQPVDNVAYMKDKFKGNPENEVTLEKRYCELKKKIKSNGNFNGLVKNNRDTLKKVLYCSKKRSKQPK